LGRKPEREGSKRRELKKDTKGMKGEKHNMKRCGH
jgi:hypothetical protein